ncbi:multiubiquitin domain-containing protein [Bradyrhizobium sp. 197]|uniref:multiubiquitin domain-containing protein n=1 Tax=Bradyrhizobium sp. 197 TaxID=2782663 RepID=UPI001FF7E658|nr:multiubiquitin domain-containing protein [Bradyrhizobium sp. 197]MCK1481014.1 multiubiquitin domain-containing protein [Bradyrhizobium sp. 197]
MTKDDNSKKHKIKVENDVYEWESQFITGAQVRALGPGIPDSMDLFLKVPGQPGRLIKNDESVDLDQHPGIEKFYAQESSSEAGVK